MRAKKELSKSLFLFGINIYCDQTAQTFCKSSSISGNNDFNTETTKIKILIISINHGRTVKIKNSLRSQLKKV